MSRVLPTLYPLSLFVSIELVFSFSLSPTAYVARLVVRLCLVTVNVDGGLVA